MQGGSFAGSGTRARLRKLIRKLLPGGNEVHFSPELSGPPVQDRLRLLQHELRAPLAGMLGMAELLQASVLSGEQQRFLLAMQESGRQLQRLLADLGPGIPSGKPGRPFSFQAADGPRFMEQILRSHWPAAVEKGIGLHLVVDHRLPDTWVSEFSWLRQILDNLLANAIKFTHSGYVLLEASYSADADEGQSTINLCVSDTGIGIAEQDARRIYRAGDRGSQVLGEQYGGSGLGLYICQQLASRLGARLLHGPAAGGGTRFLLTLPGAAATQRERTDRLRTGLLAGLNCRLALSEPWGRIVSNLLHRMGVGVVAVGQEAPLPLPESVDALICDSAAVGAFPASGGSRSGSGGPLLLTHPPSPDSSRAGIQQVPEVMELPQPLLQSNLEPLLLRLSLHQRIQRSGSVKISQ